MSGKYEFRMEPRGAAAGAAPRMASGAVSIPRADTAPRAPSPDARPRIDAIDLLRGVVLVLMTLDHTRNFFGASSMSPRDVGDAALFLTRWITHFCAPVFVFLAGASAFLYGTRGKTTRDVSRFLFTRGLWLVLLEFTLVRFGWTFSVIPDHLVMQVIWAIGMAMVARPALFSCRPAILALAIGLIAGHNLLDGIHAEQFGAAAWL